VLAAADPEDNSELYAQLGVSLSYDPSGNVTVKAEPWWGNRTCRRGDRSSSPHSPVADCATACRVTAAVWP
jgi:hypothetical protein